ncbi:MULTISPECIES: hypothetical protein [unclassified Halobacteriovorax]|uniref:hypothetical protein n=1 Tax=unclassified Halobacteriovorax TaxID=2639665 RepID=UPI000EA13839|nr:hypothetical protein [Halobacteriovorax sp. BALOs_7]
MNTVTKSSNDVASEAKKPKSAFKRLLERLWNKLKKPALAFDRKVDGAISFFIQHYGKTKFMVAMSKKIQYLGIEGLWNKGPKAFIYFFLFYLIRDTILYIIIPIWVAKATS